MSTKLFCTHHSPTGAWASLTFGHTDSGISIDFEDPKVKTSGSLLVGKVSNGEIASICFSGDTSLKQGYGAAASAGICRTLTASKDIYTYQDITFTTYTPFLPLPDPEKQTIEALHCIPGILMDVTVDNSRGTQPVTAFWGLILNDAKRAFATAEDDFYVLRHKDEWEFAAPKTADTYMIRGLDAMQQLKCGKSIVQQNGPAFVCLNVPAGEVRTLTISWSVYKHSGSNGTIVADYFYTSRFNNLQDISRDLHALADEMRSSAALLDTAYETEGQDPLRRELFFQALRGYYASSQLLIDNDRQIHWNISEGGYLWRNTMDLCADHITWELRHNPWVVRSLMDDFLKHYTYRDQVTFDNYPGTYPGGISFTHDMGCYFTYSSDGHSAYERENDTKDGFYFYMNSETRQVVGAPYYPRIVTAVLWM